MRTAVHARWKRAASAWIRRAMSLRALVMLRARGRTGPRLLHVDVAVGPGLDGVEAVRRLAAPDEERAVLQRRARVSCAGRGRLREDRVRAEVAPARERRAVV